MHVAFVGLVALSHFLMVCIPHVAGSHQVQLPSLMTLSATSTVINRPETNILAISGGDSKSGRQIRGKKTSGAFAKVKEFLSTVQPISRAYILLAVFCSLVHMVGLPAPALFSLDPSRFYEFWRPFTAVSYLGPPSMSMANNLFFLLRFGQTLETEQGPGPFAWYLLVQTTILTLLGWLLGFPFQAQAMISSIIHVCSRMSPMEQIPFQFGLVITSWQLPFCMMAIDCLSQQSLSPAWPHILGIFSGHVFLFATKIWPALGGKPRLQTPNWIINWLGDKAASNIPGMDFRAQKRQQQAKDRSSKRPSSWFSSFFGKKKTPNHRTKTSVGSSSSSGAAPPPKPSTTSPTTTAPTSTTSTRTSPKPASAVVAAATTKAPATSASTAATNNQQKKKKKKPSASAAAASSKEAGGA